MSDGEKSRGAVASVNSSHGHAGPPAVIYIAGSGRSGSTLLERALGEIPGFVNVGELVDVSRRDAPQTERCGCGQPFAECAFWTGVGERGFGGWDSEQLAGVQRLKGHVARRRHVPPLLVPRLGGPEFRADVARYGEHYARLYGAIAAQAGASCVVDASKSPVQALALWRSGIDIRVVHLVRDVRGFAHSLSKRDVGRPQALNEGDVMWSKRPAKAAGRWVLHQAQVELLRSCGMSVTRVRYEQFVRDPRRTVEVALDALGLPHGPADLKHLGDGQVTLSPSHGIAGNPSRFRYGEVMLRADEAWREGMSRRDRVLVTAIGLPFLLRYGWRSHPDAGHAR
jgi:Sulfotransferase family